MRREPGYGLVFSCQRERIAVVLLSVLRPSGWECAHRYPAARQKELMLLFLPAQVTTALLWTRHQRSSTRTDSAPPT
eukprot:220001-Rhodomonas_salina.1